MTKVGEYLVENLVLFSSALWHFFMKKWHRNIWHFLKMALVLAQPIDPLFPTGLFVK